MYNKLILDHQYLNFCLLIKVDDETDIEEIEIPGPINSKRPCLMQPNSTGAATALSSNPESGNSDQTDILFVQEVRDESRSSNIRPGSYNNTHFEQQSTSANYEVSDGSDDDSLFNIDEPNKLGDLRNTQVSSPEVGENTRNVITDDEENFEAIEPSDNQDSSEYRNNNRRRTSYRDWAGEARHRAYFRPPNNRRSSGNY